MARNIRPIRLAVAGPIEKDLPDDIKRKLIDRIINPPVTFTKEGQHELNIQRLRSRRQFKMMLLKMRGQQS